MCHGPWQYLHPSWRIPQLLQLFSCPFPMAVPSHELSTELTRGAWGTAAALPCTGRHRGATCCAGHLPFQTVLWTWLCPSSCPHPGSSGRVLGRQRVPQGFLQCMTACRKCTHFSAAAQPQGTASSSHPPASSSWCWCHLSAHGAPSTGCGQGTFTGPGVLCSPLSSEELSSLSGTLMTKPCPSFSDQAPSYISVLLNSFSLLFVHSSG